MTFTLSESSLNIVDHRKLTTDTNLEYSIWNTTMHYAARYTARYAARYPARYAPKTVVGGFILSYSSAKASYQP